MSRAKLQLFEKSRGILLGTVDRMSKYFTTLGPDSGKGNCGPFESPAVVVNATSSGAPTEELEDTMITLSYSSPYVHGLREAI